jgi:hypothetical protein
MKQSARVLHYSALSAWSVTEEGGGIALALATLDSDDAQQQRLQAELGRQRAIRDVRLFAARVMRAVVSEIGDARPSYVWKGRGWVAARHCAAHVPPRPPTVTTVCRGRGSPCKRWRRVRTSLRCSTTSTPLCNVRRRWGREACVPLAQL